MSSFIDRIAEEGIPFNIIFNRCVDVKIRQSAFFGVLNSTFNPNGTEAGAPNVPTQMSKSVSFVILIIKANIKRKFKEYIDIFVNILRNEVNIFFHVYFKIQIHVVMYSTASSSSSEFIFFTSQRRQFRRGLNYFII